MPSCRIWAYETTPSEKFEKTVFVSPCSCKGTLEYAHKHCMEDWLMKKWTRSDRLFGMKEINCENCLGVIKYQANEEYGWNSCNEVRS